MVRILVAGIAGVAGGLMIFAQSFNPGPDPIFAGGVWKGPLCIVAGIAAIVIAVRNLAMTSDVGKPRANETPRENGD